MRGWTRLVVGAVTAISPIVALARPALGATTVALWYPPHAQPNRWRLTHDCLHKTATSIKLIVDGRDADQDRHSPSRNVLRHNDFRVTPTGFEAALPPGPDPSGRRDVCRPSLVGYGG